MGHLAWPNLPMHTSEAFNEQLLAAHPDPVTGKPDPNVLKAYYAVHPKSAKAAAQIKARPISAGFT